MELKPGYKQSEVGVIPEDWQVAQIGGLKPFVTSGSRGWASYYSDRGSLFVRITNLSRDTIYLDLKDSKFVNLPPDTNEGTRTQLQEHDVLISITADIGIAGYVDSRVPTPAYINQHIALVRFDPTKTSGKFVSYFLASDKPQKLFRASTDVGAKAGMSLLTVQKLQLALPSHPEQRAIAGTLSDVDELIGALNQLIAKKRDLKLAAMQQLLTGQTRFPGFSGEWSTISMAKHASLKARIGWQALTTEEYLGSGTYYLVTGTDFIGGRVNWLTCHFVNEWRYAQDRNIQLRDGDVLLTKDGTIGKVGYVENLHGPATLNSGVFVIRPLEEAFVSLFLFYVLTSSIFDKFLSKITAGSTITHLYQKDFVVFEFLAPEIHEQNAIAAVLSDMDAELAALEQRRDKTYALKQGMMQELLTGRTRLSVSVSSKETPQQTGPAQSENKRHNWAFNEAVVIAVLANKFGSREYPLGRLRYTKLAYLMHRHVEGTPEGYLKKAAGPYNPATRYKGPEVIAQKNGYVQAMRSGTLSGFVSGKNIDQALVYFRKWYGSEVLEWLDQFRYEKNEALELLATVDMAILDLRAAGMETAVENVKGVLRADPEWKPKLRREVFSDANIKRAIAKCQVLFG